MIDPIVARCDLCRSTDDVTEAGIGARRGHLCGVCKRTLYSIVDGPDDPALPTDRSEYLVGRIRETWISDARAIQETVDAEIQRVRDAAEAARRAEIEAKRAAREAARVEAEARAAAEAEAIAAAQAERLATFDKLEPAEQLKVALAALLDGTASDEERERFAALAKE